MILKRLFVLSIYFVTATSLYAGLQINPSRAELVLKPGASYDASYNVRNEYGTPIDVRVSTKDWYVLPANKKKGLSVSRWLSVSTSSFHLFPGESKDVAYHVIVPKDISGATVAMISFMPSTGKEQGVSLVVSVPVFLTAAGTEKIDWRITDEKMSTFGGKQQISCTIRNGGNIHLRPSGFVEIVAAGKKLADLKFLEGRPVYPGSYRQIVARSDSILPAGSYQLIYRVSCAGREKRVKKTARILKSGETIVQ